MYDFSTLPGSSAVAGFEPLLVDEKIQYTFTESADEGKLYNDLNERLITLEVSLTIDREVLNTIEDDAKELRLLVDEKEEVLMRIDWLERLDKVQQGLEDVQTKEEAQKLLRLIAPCQTSPLKNELKLELETLVESLPSEQVEEVQMTDAEVLMEKAVEEAGDTFINLGKAGRDSVIADVLDQYGKNASIDVVQELTQTLEQRVKALKEVKESSELIEQLDSLPLQHLANIPTEYEEEVLEKLLITPNWNGLFHLDRLILQYTKQIEHQHTPVQEGVQATLVMNDGLMKQLGVQKV
ncbi:hypothetical protein [Savagea faecisuis]|uniref:Uncharacterized protein n=1 Tax=Savagea faecisuis TaxID=1274803 RepID=A0ABW3H163_9BACL